MVGVTTRQFDVVPLPQHSEEVAALSTEDICVHFDLIPYTDEPFAKFGIGHDIGLAKVMFRW